MENHNKLIRLDECKTIKNLDTQEYVMVDLKESKKITKIDMKFLKYFT
jgi:hypothetical protein